MNEHLEAGEQCFRIIREHETAPKGWPQTPDGAALLAYRCPSGQWTLGFGCSFWEDGTEVQEGQQLLDERRITPLLEANIARAEEYVRHYVTVELNQYQFDALVSFRFNTRDKTLRQSTRLLPSINRREWDAAAVAFTEFVYGSSTYDGKPYQDALRGLLRRRLSEALVFLGYDWAQACKDSDVALPCDRILLASGVYRDVIRPEGVTTLHQVLPIARQHPLPSPGELMLFDPIKLPTEVRAAQEASPVAGAGGLEATQPTKPLAAPIPQSTSPAVSPAGNGAGAGVPSAPAPPVAKPVVLAPKSINVDAIPYGSVDPANGAKNVTDTKRFAGMLVVGAGSVVQVLAAREVITTTYGAVFYDMTRDPIIVALFIGGLFWLVGHLTKKRGQKIITQGMTNATQVMK